MTADLTNREAVARATMCGDENCHQDREGKMVPAGGKAFCDPCIEPIVRALNDAGIKTIASCCGHGWRPGVISLADGRELVIARDYDEARALGRGYPDSNGDKMQDAAIATMGAANGDTCDTCGRVFRTAYRVPNDLWRQIAPKPETLGDHPEHLLGGTLCPDCATVAAEQIGQKLHFDAGDHGWGGATVSPGVAAIAAERRRQVEVEGWTPEHDDEHRAGEMAGAAACYAMHGLSIGNLVLARNVRGMVTSLWPWADDWWKPKDRRADLIRAGALIAAEIDRLDRAALTQEGAE